MNNKDTETQSISYLGRDENISLRSETEKMEENYSIDAVRESCINSLRVSNFEKVFKKLYYYNQDSIVFKVESKQEFEILIDAKDMIDYEYGLKEIDEFYVVTAKNKTNIDLTSMIYLFSKEVSSLAVLFVNKQTPCNSAK